METRFYSWIQRGTWRGGYLLTAPQFQAVHKFHDGQFEEFLSIQSHDAEGTQTHQPIVIDIDCPDLRVAYREMIEAVGIIQDTTQANPIVHFSGNKGYHITIPYVIHHIHCHEIARSIVETLFPGHHYIDTKIYRSRSMLRLEGSPASRPGYFKVRLDDDELELGANYHVEMSARNRQLSSKISLQEAQSTLDKRKLDRLLVDALQKLSLHTEPRLNMAGEEVIVTPCIEKMFEEAPIEGQRNSTVFLLAKHLKRLDHDQDSAMKHLLAYPHFRSLEREVRKVVRSLWKTSKPVHIGCKTTTSDGDLMRQYCDPWCPFSSEPLPVKWSK